MQKRIAKIAGNWQNRRDWQTAGSLDVPSESQEPRAKSQKPRAKSQEPRAKSYLQIRVAPALTPVLPLEFTRALTAMGEEAALRQVAWPELVMLAFTGSDTVQSTFSKFLVVKTHPEGALDTKARNNCEFPGGVAV